MKDIIDLVLEYKTREKDDILEEIFLRLKPLMLKKLKKVEKIYHEDITQEFLWGIVLVIKRIELRENGLERDSFSVSNQRYLENHQFSLSSIYALYKNKYLIHYLKGYGLNEFKNAFYDKKIEKFNEGFGRFNMHNQLLYIIEKRMSAVIASFYRRNKEIFYYEEMSLNQVNYEGKELLNEIEGPSLTHTLDLRKYGILEEDIMFLELFIENDYILTQQEVSLKLGKSQQYISKKIQQIRKKYQNKL